MLQDLEYGRLENEYRPTPPRGDDYALCFRDRMCSCAGVQMIS